MFEIITFYRGYNTDNMYNVVAYIHHTGAMKCNTSIMFVRGQFDWNCD